MMISFIIETTESSLAEPLIVETRKRLADGSRLYGSVANLIPTARPSKVSMVFLRHIQGVAKEVGLVEQSLFPLPG